MLPAMNQQISRRNRVERHSPGVQSDPLLSLYWRQAHSNGPVSYEREEKFQKFALHATDPIGGTRFN